MDDHPFLALTGVGLVLLVFAWLLLFLAPRQFWAESQCLRLGYREASLTFTGRVYCVKRLDQTDVVIPLNDIRRK